MRLSEFWVAVDAEFGAGYGRTLVHDLVLGDLGGVTPNEALSAGTAPKEVWLALCRACDIPSSRWHGVGRRREA